MRLTMAKQKARTRMTKEEIDEYICKCPYFSGMKCIDRSIFGAHIGSCSLEFHHKKICPSSECICAGKFGLTEPQESEE